MNTGVHRPEKDDVDVELLSDDQRLLMEYMFGVAEGKIPDKFVYRKPGPLNHARWLTTAVRILILYTRTLEPSETLKVLVNYILKVYGFTWFVVREHNNFTAGPDVFWDMIQGVKEVQKISKLEVSITDIVFKVMERNAFCCLGENFLASLLYSSTEEHRQIAVDKILDIRSRPRPQLSPTSIPAINFEAEEWAKLIDVSSLQCHEPPCVRHLSNTELEEMKTVQHQPPHFPLHSQSVERAVKLTTEASTTSYIWQKRHNSIIAKNKSRLQRPEFRTKKTYV
jgi:hypothetical protein